MSHMQYTARYKTVITEAPRVFPVFNQPTCTAIYRTYMLTVMQVLTRGSLDLDAAAVT